MLFKWKDMEDERVKLYIYLSGPKYNDDKLQVSERPTHVPRWWFQKFSVIPVLVLAADTLFCHYLSDILTLLLMLPMLTLIPLIRLNSAKPQTTSNSTYLCLTLKPSPNRSTRKDRWRSKSTRRRSYSSAESTSGLTLPTRGSEIAWASSVKDDCQQPDWPSPEPAETEAVSLFLYF